MSLMCISLNLGNTHIAAVHECVVVIAFISQSGCPQSCILDPFKYRIDLGFGR